MGKKPVVGLTALWIGLSVFGCDCCRNKGTAYRNPPAFNPPAGAKDVSSAPPGTTDRSATSAAGGWQGSPQSGTRSPGMSDPSTPNSRSTDPYYTPTRSSAAPGMDSSTSP